MAVIGTFAGASIIALPARPGIKQLELAKVDTVATVSSPFTGSTQVQAWPGADRWEADVTLPQMTQTDKSVWSAFFGECRGMANVFYLYDPLHRRPAGNPSGTPVADGMNAAMATTLNSKGWTPNTHGLLLPGDYIQVGHRLHEVLNEVVSDGSGNAAITIWPSLREPTTDGQTIVWFNPQGLFRLADNRRSILTTETRLSEISFKAVEAR